MNERLKLLRKSLGLTQNEFAEQLGLKQTSYSMIENGKRPLHERHIKLICLTFHVNEDWLRTGNGCMYLSENSNIELCQKDCLDCDSLCFIKRFNRLNNHDKKIVVKLIDLLYDVKRYS